LAGFEPKVAPGTTVTPGNPNSIDRIGKVKGKDNLFHNESFNTNNSLSWGHSIGRALDRRQTQCCTGNAMYANVFLA